jgi:putative hemolysin
MSFELRAYFLRNHHMKSKATNKLSIALNLILILFFIVYFLVPFSATGFWAKAFSPLCTVISSFQGQDFLPGWCLLQASKPDDKNVNANANNNDNDNNNANTNVNVGIANPASVKCVTDGGQSEIYQSADGSQSGLCIFQNQSICDEWAYFRGECKMGDCQRVCKAINTKSEGWYNSCTGDLIKAEVCSTLNTNANENSNINAPVVNTNSNINANVANPKPVSSSTITVSSPVANEQLTSPIIVTGRAKTADNKIYARVKSKTGQAIINTSGTVKNIGADGYGDFSMKIPYEFSSTKEGFVEVFSKSDEAEVNLVSIAVEF